MAQKPFSDETISAILPLLDDTNFVRELGEELKQVFKVGVGNVDVLVAALLCLT